MKRFSLVILAVLFSISIFAQVNESEKKNEKKEEKKEDIKKVDEIKTLMGNNSSHGFYIDFSPRYMKLGGADGAVFGGKMAYLGNHTLGFGFAGYFFGNEAKYDNVLKDEYGLRGGYGGIVIEQVIMPKMPVHLTIPIVLGVGGVAYARNDMHNHNEWDNDNNDWNDNVADSQAFVIFNPGVELEVNLMKHFRIGAGAYYNLTSNLNLKDDVTNTRLVDPKALNGFSFGINLKIGIF